GCFSRPQIPLLPITTTTGTLWRGRVSSSMPAKTSAPSPASSTTRRLGRAGVARARAQTAVRPGIDPTTRFVRVDHTAGIGDEVAPVAHDDRITIQDLGQLAVDPHRVKGRAWVGQLCR